MYFPKVWENLIDEELRNPNFKGIRVGDHFESPAKILESIREKYLETINKRELPSPVRATIALREIDNYKDLRKSLDRYVAGDPELLELNLGYRVVNQEELLINLYKNSVISPEQILELSRQFPAMAEKFKQVRTIPKYVETPPIIEPVAILPEPEIAVVEPAYVTMRPYHVLTKPVSKKEELESWQKLPTGVELTTVQAKELEKLLTIIGQERQKLQKSIAIEIDRRLFKSINIESLFEKIWNNRKFQRVLLTGLLLSTTTFKFKEGDLETIFSLLTRTGQNIPPAVESLSRSAQAAIDQTYQSLENSPVPTSNLSVTNFHPEVPQFKEINSPDLLPVRQEIPVAAEIKPSTLESLIKFDTSFSGFGKSIESHPPPRKPVSDSEYAKIGVDLKGNLAYGIGDISSLDELNALPGDFNAKTIRVSVSGNSLAEIKKDWNTRAKAIIKQAHGKGLNVRTVISLTHLPSEEDWRNFLIEVIQNAPESDVPNALQFGNEVGWCASDGTPEQYFLEPKGMISDKDKGLPKFVRIEQDVIKASKKNVIITLPSLAFTYAWYDEQIRAYYKGMVDAGVELNSVEVDSHVFLTEVDNMKQENHRGGFDDLLRQQVALKELGYSPSLVMNEAYFGADMTQIQIEAYLKYQHEVLGVKTIVLHPVTGRFDNVKKK